jgi:aldehyde:ferredoxin oxidoreductase
MYGWHGQALYVNLSTHTTRSAPISPELLHAYLGGRGLGVRLIRDYHRLDPFDPDLPLIFAVGPLCGSTAPTTARIAVVSRSPLTGTVYDNSDGGRFALHLKQAGYDALIITGQSERPVSLRVAPNNATIDDASILWSSTIPATSRALERYGSVAAIGPAGENKVLYASIMMGDGNVVGRGGLGAVMGNKNLKAIVVNGDRKTAIADPERTNKARHDIMRLFKASPVIFGELGIAEFGTPTLVDLLAQRRMTPTNNFLSTFFAGSGNYSGPTIQRRYQTRKDGCYTCPVQCRKSTPEGIQLPEYETASHFGALLNNSDLNSIVRANTICNEIGLDPISAAATLATWSEIRGRYPRGDELEPLLRDIAVRKGDGELLATGSKQVAAEMGQPDAAMTVKGLELPAYDPRGAYGMALAYGTSSHGGCHLGANPITHEILRKPVATDRFSFAGKGRITKTAEDNNAVGDSMIACKFVFFAASLEEYAEALSGVTGQEFTPQVLGSIGEKICLTERFYNQQNGFDANDDILPERFYRETGSSGNGIDITPIDRGRFLEERRKYYQIRGLDEQGRIANKNFLTEQP